MMESGYELKIRIAVQQSVNIVSERTIALLERLKRLRAFIERLRALLNA
jgi:hypothetical protein